VAVLSKNKRGARSVEISISGNSLRLAPARLSYAARDVLSRRKQAKSFSCAIVFVSAAKMRALAPGRARRAHTPNVLSFPLGDTRFLRGDIFICVPVARSEARRYGIPVGAYAAFLVVHGMLHIAGFSHEKSRRARISMEAHERAIMKHLFPHSSIHSYLAQ